MTKDLDREYKRLMSSWHLDGESLDYGILDRYIRAYSESDRLYNAAVTIYDNYRCEHAYVSDYHRKLFGDGPVEPHPDDLDDVLKNMISSLKHVFEGNRNVANIKIVREYRARLLGNGEYKRVTESLYVLETDCNGKIWLVLCIIEISPNQALPFNVNSQIINITTGEVFSPLDRYYKKKYILTKRESEVLCLIAKGLLSKEISGIMGVSVHTVNTYRQHILEKLNVDNSLEAVRFGLSIGLVQY